MKKRSSYRPKPVRLDNMAFVKMGLAPAASHRADMQRLRIANHGALHELSRGTGTVHDANTLVNVLNFTLALQDTAGLGTDWREEVQDAETALREMLLRGAQRGRHLFAGLELTAINLLMEIHDAQLEACTVLQMERAVEYVQKMTRAGRAMVITTEKEEA